MPTESAQQALEILRKGSETFQWYVIPLLAFVFYVYTVEAEKRNWNLFLAGLAFWGMDWFNEIWNGLVMHFTNGPRCCCPIKRPKSWAFPGLSQGKCREGR